MPDWKAIAAEWFNARGSARGSMSSFYYHLCYAITVADKENTERLRETYPDLVKYIKGGLEG